MIIDFIINVCKHLGKFRPIKCFFIKNNILLEKNNILLEKNKIDFSNPIIILNENGKEEHYYNIC
jgi:hypothetical protein